MPRKTAIPEYEKAVGLRLSEARDLLLFAQTATAVKLSISRNQLVSYELGTVPLPWPVGERFCGEFGFSQKWLATGSMPKRVYAPLDPEVIFGVDSNRSFHSVVTNELRVSLEEFYRHLSTRLNVDEAMLDASADTSCTPPAGHEAWRGIAQTIGNFVQRNARRTPPRLHIALFDHMLVALHRFVECHQKEIDDYVLKFSKDPVYSKEALRSFGARVVRKKNVAAKSPPKG